MKKKTKNGLNLAIIGTIKDDILQLTEIAYALTKYMLENYRKNLINRYSIEETQIQAILRQNQPENENIYQIMQIIGKNRGAVIAGGMIDDEKTSKILLEDLRSGKLGKITLEKIEK